MLWILIRYFVINLQLMEKLGTMKKPSCPLILSVKNYLFRLLIYGVTRCIPAVDGLLGGRFILAYLACTFHGLAKEVVIGWAVLYSSTGPSNRRLESSMACGLISALFLPQFLMAVCSTIGFSINSFKTMFHHIELLLLPTGII